MALPNQPPTRHTSGVCVDSRNQPFGGVGLPNPLFYHMFVDDFDQEVNETGAYTKTTTGNGTVALAAGDGGLAVFTTNSSTPATSDVAAIQLPVAGFTVTPLKLLAYQVRLQVSDVVNAAINVGLIQTTTTPFTVTDGIWISKASGVTNFFLNIAVASALTQVQIPAAAITAAQVTSAQNFDLGFVVGRLSATNTVDVTAFIGSQAANTPLTGWVPNQVGGARGPVARLIGPTTPTANLNPTIALQSGTASSKTATVDYWGIAKER